MSIISDVIDLATKAKKLADKMANLELKEAIVDLQSKLVDLKQEIVDLREENMNLRAEAAKLALPPEVTMKDGAYFKGDDGPFCIGCFDSGQKLHRLVEQTGLHATVSKWRCPICKVNFGQPTHPWSAPVLGKPR